MAEITCPSPFSAAASLDAILQVEIACPDDRNPAIQTWNPSDKNANIILSEENLKAGNTANLEAGVRGTQSKSSGKWYWEVKVLVRGSSVIIGTGDAAVSLDLELGYNGNAYSYHYYSGKKIHGSSSAYGDSYTTGDIIGVALDLDAGKIWFSKNNVWQAAGDPAAGTNEAFSSVSGTFFPMVSLQGNADSYVKARFNSFDQSYAPPAGFESIGPSPSPFITETSLLATPYPCYVDLDAPLTAAASLNITLQQETPAGTFSAASSGQTNTQVEISSREFSAVGGFTCDHCFNYAQVAGFCPVPESDMLATFRHAKIVADAPVPTGGFVVGKIISGDSPTPNLTCAAHQGRNPSIIANSPCPGCSMRVGLSLSDVATISRKAGVPIPTCSITTYTHHIASMYGNVPCPTVTCNANTENIATLIGSAPCCRGLFAATVGNVANVHGMVSVPYCSMSSIPGIVASISGSVPTAGSLVRFYASLLNESITLGGTAPTPKMLSRIHGLQSLILRHIRGEVR